MLHSGSMPHPCRAGEHPASVCHSQWAKAAHAKYAPWLPDSGGQGGVHIWDHRLETIRETAVDRIPPPVNCINSRLKHNPSLPMKTPYFLVMEPEGQHSGLPHIPRCPQKTWEGKNHISALLWHCQTHWYLQEGSLYTHLKPQFLQLSLRAQLQIFWNGSQHGLQLQPTRQFIFTYLKSCCLRIWPTISLKLGPIWDPFFWNTNRSWNNLNNWDPSRYR